MKRAVSPVLLEVVADAVNSSDGAVYTEIVSDLADQQTKRQKIEAEMCLDDGIIYEEEEFSHQSPPEYQNLIIQHMDIAEPLTTLRELLETRLQCSLADHQFYLQDSIELSSDKSLVDQCVQGEGMVQINLEVKSQPGVSPRINILDILKTADDEIEEKYVAEPEVQSSRVVVPLPEESENVTRWIVDQGFRRDQEKFKIPLDPAEWSRLHVRHWVQWAVKEFQLLGVDIDAFSLTGQQLCSITHPEFTQLIPHDPGDIFWTHLELLRKCKFVAVMQKPNPHAITTITVCSDGDRRYGRMKAVGKHRPRSPRLNRDDRISPGNRTGNNGQIQLWQFLLELLTDRLCREVIAWIGTEGEFKLINPELVAQMWGQRKNKPTMNYEKLSRALRYYYDGDMISKVHGKRFVYKFVCDLRMLLGYTAAELSRLVGTEDFLMMDRRHLQPVRPRTTFIATIKDETEANMLEHHTAAAHIIEHRTQVVQTMD